MSLQLKPINKLTYKLKLTPHLRLAINLLPMPLLKLKEYIKEQLEENPLLEIENTGLPPKPKETFEINSFDFAAKPPTLQEHLSRQLEILANSDFERQIGELIIGNIDDDGYFRCSAEDVVRLVKTDILTVGKVLSSVQSFDPAGVGARDLRECLLLQLKAKGEENSLTGQIVDKYLLCLEKKRFNYIAKQLDVSVEKVKEGLKEIAKLEPKPGRSFGAEKTIRLVPDAMLQKNKNRYEVILNNWELPSITLNHKYRKMIKEKGTPQDAKGYLRERLKAARTLIDAIKHRKETVKKVIEDIVFNQKGFLDSGEGSFKPMTLGQIAKRIGRHKSTVSRTVTNKYLQTPYGIIELRNFLNSGIKQKNGEIVSSKVIKSRIKVMIGSENKKNPLTDKQIIKYLKREGISVSRRTVTKYRNRLKILSSKLR